MNCMRGKCFFNAVILDIGCMLDGRSCGPNMIFSAIQKGKYRISFIEYSKCIVQCLCMAGYVEEDGQCIKSVDNENSVENPVSWIKFSNFSQKSLLIRAISLCEKIIIILLSFIIFFLFSLFMIKKA